MTPAVAEKQRQDLFRASCAKIGKIWPDHANFRLDNPQNRTDEAAQERLQATSEALDACWLAARAPDAPQATQAAFLAALATWELERFHAVLIFGIDTDKKKR